MTAPVMSQFATRLECLEARNKYHVALVDQLRAVCAEAYQLAGALNAPVEALDNLSAAANGEPLPHATFLPVAVPDVVQQRDQLLAALKDVQLCGHHLDDVAMRRVSEAIAAVEQPAVVPAADADCWIEWSGGDCPVPEGTLVDVKFANGEPAAGVIPAEEWDWTHDEPIDGFDIVAYRVVQGGDS